LTATARQFGGASRIVETVIKSNELRKRAMVGKIVESCGGSVCDKRLAILGLAFKANTDDVRESASLTIVPRLEELGARVCAYDPAAMEQARKFLPRLRTAQSPYDCVAG